MPPQINLPSRSLALRSSSSLIALRFQMEFMNGSPQLMNLRISFN
jgi:hypothetical protein